MWLINTQTLKLHEIIDPEDAGVRYAILSHTWGSPQDEVSMSDFADLSEARKKSGFAKIEKTCEIAKSEGLEYAWVDTCCIDKSSSAELSEAINSMFMWYRLANVCYIYLQDLQGGANDLPWYDPGHEKDLRQTPALRETHHQQCVDSNFARCRWFSRGWTLQELIAPRKAVFYNSQWCQIASKHDIAPTLSLVTGVHRDILVGNAAIGDVPVFTRMCWAAKRTTTRVEDTAYCLLGIFDINIPLIYGEGPKAFRRLQEEIIRKTGDISILAWSGQNPPAARYRPRSFRDWNPSPLEYRGALAWAPCDFTWASTSPARQSVFEQDAVQNATAIYPAASLGLGRAQSVTIHNATVVYLKKSWSDSHMVSSEILQLPGNDGYVYRRLRRCLTGYMLEGLSFEAETDLFDSLARDTTTYALQGSYKYYLFSEVFSSLTLLDALSPKQTDDLRRPIIQISISCVFSNALGSLCKSDPLWPISRWSDVTFSFALGLDELSNDTTLKLVALQQLRTSFKSSSGTVHDYEFIIAIGSKCHGSDEAGCPEHRFQYAIVTRESPHLKSTICTGGFDLILEATRTSGILPSFIRNALLAWLSSYRDPREDSSIHVQHADGSTYQMFPHVSMWHQRDNRGQVKYFFDFELRNTAST